MLEKIPELIFVGAFASVFVLIYLGKVDIVIEFMGNAIKIISK
jgi:hypothetical protein